VHLRSIRQAGLLSMLGDDAIERPNVFERSTHENWIVNAHAIVGEHDDVSGTVMHGTEFRQVLALQSNGHGAHGANICVAGLMTEMKNLFDDAGRILHGRCIRHGVDASESAGRGCPGAGQNCLSIFAARLAQMRMKVDEARQGNATLGVMLDSALGYLEVLANSGDDAVVERNISNALTEK